MTKAERDRLEELEKLYTAVDAYCTKSQETKGPVSERYWSAVVIAWERAKRMAKV